MSRNLVPETINRFKGINRSRSLTSLSPEFAQDCLNVIPSSVSGGLDKLRYPVALSEAIAGIGTGPDQFALFENATLRQLLAFFGADIYKFDLDAFTPTLVETNADNQGETPWSVVLSNNLAFMCNGIRNRKWTGTDLQLWGIAQPGSPVTVGVVAAGSLTLVTGRMYRYAGKNSVTGHVGKASAISASTGAITNKKVPITTPALSDMQVDTHVLYATLDGGTDYFKLGELTVVLGAAGVWIADETPDEDLDQSERAPLINDPPPVGKFLAVWSGRIFLFNLVGDRQSIAYTGYERILTGRPEEACPPNNRLRLAIGADEIAGGGVLAAGVVAFDRSDRMFMFQGLPEDITVDAPVQFSAFLQELPWHIGCASHETIRNTPYGLIWLTADRKVCRFDGQSAPQEISDGAEPIMARITDGRIGISWGAYFNYVDRDWYALLIPVDGSSTTNLVLMVDLDPDPKKNVGLFPIQIPGFSIQSIGVIEMASKEHKLVVGAGGLFHELKVRSTTTGGINLNKTATAATLGAWWRSGYFGNEKPTFVKMMRWARLVADNTGFKVKRFLVDDEAYLITGPKIIDFDEGTVEADGKISTNEQCKRMAIEIRFPEEDVDCSILQLTNNYIAIGER